jgi:hypothetical protein
MYLRGFYFAKALALVCYWSVWRYFSILRRIKRNAKVIMEGVLKILDG